MINNVTRLITPTDILQQLVSLLLIWDVLGTFIKERYPYQNIHHESNTSKIVLPEKYYIPKTLLLLRGGIIRHCSNNVTTTLLICSIKTSPRVNDVRIIFHMTPSS